MKKLIPLAFLMLPGCIHTVPLNFTPDNVVASPVKLDAMLVSTEVSTASVKGNTHEKRRIDTAGFEGMVQSLWKSALDDSIARAAVFNDNASRKVNLSVRIERLAVPKGGMVMHTGTLAHYELIDRATGRVIYATDVETDGRVPGSYAFAGATRARESISRAVQANIAEFLHRLPSAQLAG